MSLPFAARSGATADDLFRRDLATDAFRIQGLKAFQITDIAVYPNKRQALIQLRRLVDHGEYAFEQITAEKNSAGAWGLDVDWHLLLNTPAPDPDAPPPTLEQALDHVAGTYGLPVSKALLAPVN